MLCKDIDNIVNEHYSNTMYQVHEDTKCDWISESQLTSIHIKNI